jgi:putative transposase
MSCDRCNRDIRFHFNPVKHGLVERVVDWPVSTFHALVKQGVYPPDWGGGHDISLSYDD